VADLILLAANPLTNIANTQKIEGVMAGTVWMSKADIKRELKSLERNKVKHCFLQRMAERAHLPQSHCIKKEEHW
jgi:hypothetical protein